MNVIYVLAKINWVTQKQNGQFTERSDTGFGVNCIQPLNLVHET